MIFLTGLTGSGKTTVGKWLARKLKWRFRDSDRMVERIAGRPVGEIFRLKGEREFRRLESQALRSLEGQRRVVIATGGGLVLKAANRAWMRRHGVVVHLDLPPAVIAKRLKPRDFQIRPLLQGGAGALAILAKKRRPFYRQAHLTIRELGSPAQLARVILRQIREKRPLVLHDKTAR